MTSGNDCEAPAVVGSTAQNGENKPPQAIVKPQVLTHVIEGFVIQEGAEPFPVSTAFGVSEGQGQKSAGLTTHASCTVTPSHTILPFQCDVSILPFTTFVC